MAKTYWIFPTMSSSFSWRDCTTSKLKGQIAKHLRIGELAIYTLVPFSPIYRIFLCQTTQNIYLFMEVTEYTRTYPWMSIEWDWWKIEYSSCKQRQGVILNVRKYNFKMSAKLLVNIKNNQRSRCENLKAWWLWWQIQGQIHNLLVQLYQPAEDWSLDCSQWPVC